MIPIKLTEELYIATDDGETWAVGIPTPNTQMEIDHDIHYELGTMADERHFDSIADAIIHVVFLDIENQESVEDTYQKCLALGELFLAERRRQ